MSSTIVATENLTKCYGSRVVVENLNLRIPAGSVYGFLGPNGAGKSTTMKMLLSLIQPTSGAVEIMGRPMTRGTRRKLLGNIGSLIEAPPGYAHLTGAENMRLVQRLLGLTRQQTHDAVRAVRLQDQMDKRVRDYSLGMKQRLGIAMALARQPRLLILDEPTNGLDPAGIEEMRALLRHLGNAGVTVMVSSHLLGEIDKTANVLGILSGGRMIFQGSRSELMAASTPDVIITCSDPHTAVSALRSFDARLTETGEVALPDLDDRQTRHRRGPRRRAGRRLWRASRRADTRGRVHASHRERWAVSARAVTNEFAKMRHLRVGVVAMIMIVAVLGLSLYAVVSNPDFDPDSPAAWNALLAGMSLGIPLISPLLLAVLASRQTDIEHQGNGWLLHATSRLTPGGVCRAKLVALGVVVGAVTIGTSLLVLLAGKLLAGILPSPPIAHWAGFTGCMLVVNLVVLALHLLLSAKVENQLVALGIGVLGCVLAVFSQGLPAAAAHVTPWGYYALAKAADSQAAGFVALPLAYPSIAALAVIGTLLFVMITYRFDRQEA